jgi:hypothetical protein
MRKLVSQVVFCAVFAFAMFAQSSTGNSGQASGSSSSSDPYQGSQNQGSQTSSGAGNQQSSIEGCIFERRTAYYIQPVNGDAPTQLSAGNQDLSSYQGQDVRVSGNMTGGSNTSASNSTSGSTGSVAGTADQGQILQVTRVDEVAKHCPANTQQQIDQGNSSAASPR